MDIKKHEKKIDALKAYLLDMKIFVNNFHYYQEALTHRSYSNELHEHLNYQRLEYFGDAIIDKIVCEILFHLPQHLDEGKMSTIQRMLVQQSTIVKAAKEIKLDQHIFLGKGASKNISDKIICDCFEAFIAAIYLDHNGDEFIPKKIIETTLIHYYLENDLADSTDYKSILQEMLQTSGIQKIEYNLINDQTKNSSHKMYVIEIVANGIIYGRGHGHSIKTAERIAAKNALSKHNN